MEITNICMKSLVDRGARAIEETLESVVEKCRSSAQKHVFEHCEVIRCVEFHSDLA